MSDSKKNRYAHENALLVAPFLLLLATNVWFHAPWGDELHAWGLILASSDIGDLFRRLHYEGHPGLWHLLLWWAAAVSMDPATLAAVHLAVASGILLLVAFHSYFSRAEKILLLSNYFLVFEYTVVARNYGVAMLLALVYGRIRAATTERPLLAFTLLGTIANTNIHALLLAGFLGVEYGWSSVITAQRWSGFGLWRKLSGPVVFCALIALAMATVWPAADIAHHVQQPMLGGVGDFRRLSLQLLQTATTPYFPIDFSFPASFAFPGRLYENGLRVWTSILLLPFIGGALWVAFRDRVRFLIVLVGLELASAAFAFLIYPVAIRHLGAIFVGFLVLVSIHRSMPSDPGSTARPTASIAVLCLLALGSLGGVLAIAGQWMRPFSNDVAAARWLTNHASADAVLIASDDIRAEPIAILLRRRFYALDCRCEDSYVQFRNRRDGFTENMIPERLEEAVRLYRPRPIMLLAGTNLSMPIRTEIRARGMTLTEEIHLTGAERDSEMTIFKIMP